MPQCFGASVLLNSRGHDLCFDAGVCARRVEDLTVWRLGDEIRTRVYAITCGDPVAKDFKFCDQARDAAGSVARNIAEGFGRYRHKEFAQFLSIARGSVFEVRDHLQDGAKRNYWTREQVADIESLCNRTIAALTRFIRFLRNNPDP